MTTLVRHGISPQTVNQGTERSSGISLSNTDAELFTAKMFTRHRTQPNRGGDKLYIFDSMAATKVLDPIAQDPVAWCVFGEMDYRVSKRLFNSGDPMLYFAATIIGHHALELYLKGSLIKLGMKACDPKKAKSFGILRSDCVWGHDLGLLGQTLATKTSSFNLNTTIDVRGYPPVRAPGTIGEGLKFFDPYLSGLRYPKKITIGGVSKDHKIVLDAIVKELRPFLAAIPKNYMA